MDHQRGPRGRESGQAHALLQCRTYRLSSRGARVQLVADERRITDDGVHQGKRTSELARGGYIEEVALEKVGIKALALEQPRRLRQRPTMNIHPEQSLVEDVRRGPGRFELRPRCEQKYSFATRWVQNSCFGITTNRPRSQVIRYGRGREKGAPGFAICWPVPGLLLPSQDAPQVRYLHMCD